MTAGCAMLSHEPNEIGCPGCPLPGQGQLWHPRNGALQSCWQHPQVFICALCQLAWRIFYFFFSLFITSVHIQSTRKECLEFCCLQQQCRTCTGAPSLSGTKPAGYLNISASNSSKQMFGFQSNFSLCYSNLEIFPSQVPNLHSSI